MIHDLWFLRFMYMTRSHLKMQLNTSIHLTPSLSPYTEHNTATDCPDVIPITPPVVASISAANTLLLLVSLATFIASCAVLRRAKWGRRKNTVTVNDYDMVDDAVKAQIGRSNGKAVPCPVYADANAVPLSTQPQYQALQMQTTENHLYTIVTNS